MAVRAELAQPGTQIVDPSFFNGLFSTHAAFMIFLFIIPVFAGIANYVLPLMIGAPDMAFPRLNALSFWMLPMAGVLFLASYFVPGGAFDAGWTGYAPLSTGAPLGQSFFNLGVQFAGASSVATALNFLVTIITMRAPGMTFWRMPLLVWANLSTSLLVVAATPFIAGAQFMVLFDRALNTNFFQEAMGGDVLSYQHIFWFYSHPAVYIMMLPGFGIISEVFSTHARKPIFGYRLMALALIGIVVLSYTVWAHHMFVSGMFSWLRVPMMITTLLIAVPTGIKIFSWLATLFDSVLHLKSTAMLFSLGFIVTFVVGGISGVMLGMVPLDIHMSDTYFIVAHIHFVLFGGSVFTIFAGLYHWFPKMTGRMYDERLGRMHFWLTLVGMLGTFVPMHWIGLEGMPRRVADYAAQFGDWNLVISIFSFILGAAQLIFIYNVVVSWKWGPKAGDNPWRAKTIEWLVSSPPPVFNFDEIPRVVGGPYEFGVPGARHAILARRRRRRGEPAEARGGRGDIGSSPRASRTDMAEGHAEAPKAMADVAGGTVLCFLNEVAGGRKLLEAVRERVDAGAERVAIAAPQNQPMAGQIVDRDELADAARSRVEVTQAVFAEFGIEAEGAVMDPDPLLALDDADPRLRAVRGAALVPHRVALRPDAPRPRRVGARRTSRIPITHIPVRIDDDAVRWDVTHTLVVATQTVASADLVGRLKSRAQERPHRYTFICPRSGQLTREEVCDRLARTLAEMYRSEIDATGQPMSPAPFAAVQNAIEHYRVDEILISTLAGEQSVWLEEGLIDRVKEITDKPVEHVEAGGDVAPAPADEPPRERAV